MENLETQGLARGPQSVGSQLRAAREALGKSRSEIASQTKIAERHLISLEEDRLGDLAARTYAVGFARTYARAVGLDERIIAAKVREQLDHDAPQRVETLPSFEPGDPARVPTRRLAWVAVAGVIVVLAVVLAFWSNFLSPEGELPDLVADQTEAPVAAPRPQPVAPPPALADGPVVLTATGDKVWVKVTDAKGDQLLQKELAKGESWTVPDGQAGLQLRTGRPDALQISIGGQPLPPLSTEPQLISGVSLAAADLRARGNPAGQPSSPPASPAPVAILPIAAPSAPAARTVPSTRAPTAAQRPARRQERGPAPRPTAESGPTEAPTPESLLPSSIQ
ncbi:helix-turn-helix domain-containing protein [Novosphingobium resinovorum]|uniref:helix-turn-helix domain-containing protein n=1 Tax=Novosphingobium resinovorum TaxID=158500 RepID=UPI002ED668B8|nr:helix-turn-helix domain-containing protein [Novosphingobium resinovorum]